MREVESELEDASRGYHPRRGVPDALEAVLRRSGRRSRMRSAVGGVSALSITALLLVVLVSAFGRTGTEPPGAAEETPPAFVLQVEDGGHVVVWRILPDGTRSRFAYIETKGELFIWPDMALSPDQKTLFVTSSTSENFALYTYDVDSGHLMDRTSVGPAISTQVPWDYLSAGADGRVFVYQNEGATPETARDFLSIYDSTRAELVPGRIDLGWCGGVAKVHPLPGRVVVVCGVTRQVRIMDLGIGTEVLSESIVDLPPGDASAEQLGEDPLVGSLVSPDGRTLVAVTGQGTVTTVDLESEEATPSVDLSLGPNEGVTIDGVMGDPSAHIFLATSGASGGFDSFKPTLLREFDPMWREVSRTPLPTGVSRVSANGRGLAFLALRENGLVIREVRAGIPGFRFELSLPSDYLVDIIVAA